MPIRWKIFVTLVFIGALGTLSFLDVILLPQENALPIGAAARTDLAGSTPPGVAVASGPDMADVLKKLQLNAATAGLGDGSLLSRIVSQPQAVQTYVLVKSDDRVGLLSWTESPNVKEYFAAMRQALIKSFSSGVRNLRDEQLADPGKPIRDMLSFQDPAISDEQIVLLRVRDRLYEVHIAPGKDAEVQAMLEAVSE